MHLLCIPVGQIWIPATPGDRRRPGLKMTVADGVFHFPLPGSLKRVLSSHASCTAIAVLIAFACYWNSLQGELVHDDTWAIVKNKDIQPSAPIFQLFQDDFWGKSMSSAASHKSYRPLTILTFRINYAFHGLDPWGYHVINVALHAVATALFGWFCRTVVFLQGDLSFLCMLLFAVHPVHTEAVE